MDYKQDPTYVRKDRFLEQIMIEQLNRTHFPNVSDWIFEGMKEGENGSVPLLTWTNYIGFINRTSEVHIPEDAQLIVTRHPGLPSVIHSHDYYEACYILSGACTNVINNQLEYLKEGDFCLLPPGARHDYEFLPDSLVFYFSIHPAIFSGCCATLLDGETTVSHFLLDSLYNGNHEQYLLVHTGDDRSLRLMAMFMFQLMVGFDQTSNPVLGAQLLSFFARMNRYPQIRVQSTPPEGETSGSGASQHDPAEFLHDHPVRSGQAPALYGSLLLQVSQGASGLHFLGAGAADALPGGGGLPSELRYERESDQRNAGIRKPGEFHPGFQKKLPYDAGKIPADEPLRFSAQFLRKNALQRQSCAPSGLFSAE